MVRFNPYWSISDGAGKNDEPQDMEEVMEETITRSLWHSILVYNLVEGDMKQVLLEGVW